MKLTASIIKSFKENIRDWKVLAMVLLFSPFFILLIYLFYGNEATTYKIGLMNLDKGSASIALSDALEQQKSEDGHMIFKFKSFNEIQQLKYEVKEKTIDIGIVIPKDYSKKLIDNAAGNSMEVADVSFYGSMGNVNYAVAAIYASNTVYGQGMEVKNISLPSEVNETFLEKNKALNEFDGYVPGLISLAVLMILFTATASLVKENEKMTLIRLKLSRLGSFNLLTGTCIVQAAVASIAVVISYLTALGLGYKPSGGLVAVLVVGLISSLSITAISLLLASFLNTVFDVLTIGCFPFFILMFFSGSMFPLPKMSLFSICGYKLGITDLLPLTHTANAFNKILNYGSGISAIAFEIIMIAILTVIYFLIGLILYNKRRLSKA